MTQAIQLYTESVQGGIPQRIANPPGILFLLLNAKVFLGIDDLLMCLLMVELLSPMDWRSVAMMMQLQERMLYYTPYEWLHSFMTGKAERSITSPKELRLILT